MALAFTIGMALLPITAQMLLAAFPAVLLAQPGAVHGGVTIPEPTDLALFTLGVAGLIIGRRAARRREKAAPQVAIADPAEVAGNSTGS